MTRRKTKNKTRLARIRGIGSKVHDAWIGYVCIRCRKFNTFCLGNLTLSYEDAYLCCKWTCQHCGFDHHKDSVLPFKEWDKEHTKSGSIQCVRFWQAFFKIATENTEAYWKQCGLCGRVLPANAFSRHSGWGPLEKQMECRSCKGAINAILNPKRTKQQLHESSIRRRAGDLLLANENKSVDINDLFRRFNSKCFKTGKTLHKKDRKSWAIDHILPSTWLYPLTKENAALLSKEANDNKRDKWPNDFYTNSELIELAKLTGANLDLLSRNTPIVNPDIDVNKCVSRVLAVREGSNLKKIISGLKKLISDYGLVDQLSNPNKKMLGYR